MSNGPLSPMMLVASEGLLQNQGLEVNGNLLAAIDTYVNSLAVSNYDSALSNLEAAANIAPSTISSMKTLGSTTLPALTNVIPAAWANAITANATSFTGAILEQANNDMGNGDLTIFAQVYNMAQGYRSQANEFVNSANNTNSLTSTFTTTDDLTTGSMSQVTKDFASVSADLARAGNIYDLSRLESLGHPWLLLLQMSIVGSLTPAVIDALLAAGVPRTAITDLVQRQAPFTDSVDLLAYQALQKIQGGDLEQVLAIFGSDIPALTSMADLLDLRKVLPDSFDTLRVSVPGLSETATPAETSILIYDQYQQVNPAIQTLFGPESDYSVLKKIIPPDQALAIKAFARSLAQVKNIFETTLPQLAAAMSALETNQGLGDIESLTQPVPASAKQAIDDALATGTGPGNNLTLFDLLGAAAGYPYTQDLANVSPALTIIADQGELVDLVDIYDVMNNTLAGVYGPPGNVIIPGYGTFVDYDSAFSTALIPAANAEISSIASTSDQTTVLNDSFDSMASHLAMEQENLGYAQVDFAELTTSRSAMMSLITNLHSIGTDRSPQGPYEFFLEIANVSTRSGQAVVGAMREGQNISSLENIGIITDTQLSSTAV